MSLPPFTGSGDLPLGVHAASLAEVLDRFAMGSARRKAAALRLERIYHLARSTGHLARFIVFGSFVTDKPEPNDVDAFLLMEDSFDASELGGEARLLFEHSTAQAHFGASVFWLRHLACLGAEQETVEYLANDTWGRQERDRGNHLGGGMITNDQELEVTLDRICRFQEQVAYLRQVETNPANYRLAASAFLAEIDRMQLEVRDYLSLHPAESRIPHE